MSLKQKISELPKPVKIVGGLLLGALVIWGGFKLFRVGQRVVVDSETKKTNTFYVEYLVNNGFALQGGADVMTGFDNAFLKAWYLAAKAGQSTFNYQGKNYKTKSGKAA